MGIDMTQVFHHGNSRCDIQHAVNHCNHHIHRYTEQSDCKGLVRLRVFENGIVDEENRVIPIFIPVHIFYFFMVRQEADLPLSCVILLKYYPSKYLWYA